MKTCSRCGKSKALSEFYQRRASADGLNSACKVCDLQGKADDRERFKARSSAEVEAAAAARGPKVCRNCKVTKGPEEFPRDRGHRHGRSSMCLPCAAAHTTYYRGLVDPDVFRHRRTAEFGRNRETYRNQQLRKNFGITLDDYRAMLTEQQGLCRICNQAETKIRAGRLIALAVDHDHVTGAIRGLLCNNCNHGLGHFKDSPDLLRRAALYIENHTQAQLRESPPA